MNKIKRCLIWLSRIHRCRGFGIQSPTDYAFVRYVVNEHWPYYAYCDMKTFAGDALRLKLGRLYFRLANWRQPTVMLQDEYEAFWKAGCRKIRMASEISHLELGRITMDGGCRQTMEEIYNKVDERSVLVVEGIFRNMDFWHEVEKDPRTGVTFDLYYCGIVFFDKARHKMNYIINY